MSTDSSVLPGPASWSHEDFVREILRRTLPLARTYGLVDADNQDQVRAFTRDFMDHSVRAVGDEESHWDPRYLETFLHDGLVDVVREVLWA